MRRQFFTIIFFLAILLIGFCPNSFGDESYAFNLALLHARASQPEKVFFKKEIRPEQSLISEFQWILDTLQNRCLNPEKTIADTIVETWIATKKNQLKYSVLYVARELSKTARDTRKFGKDRVNFRMTSQYWLNQKLLQQNSKKISQKTSTPKR